MRYIIKGISLVVAFTFTVNCLLWAVPEQGFSTSAPKPADNKLSLDDFHIPEQYGRVEQEADEKLFRIRSKEVGREQAGDRVVFLIKDAHCVFEAQKNIGRIINLLNRDHQVDLVCVEGASGLVQPEILAVSPDEARRRQVADKYLKNGYLTAAEAIAMVAGKECSFQIRGVENLDLYLKDLEVFRNVYEGSQTADTFFRFCSRMVHNLKEKLFSPSALVFDKRIMAYRSKGTTLSETIFYLAEFNQQRLSEYPELHLIFRTIQLESAIDFTKVEEERIDLIRTLESSLEKEEVSSLVKHSLLFKAGKISSYTYYGYLKKLMSTDDLKIYPNLYRYIRLVKMEAMINSGQMFQELDRLIEDTYKDFLKDKLARELHEIDEQVSLLQKLLKLELTREQWLKYQHTNINIAGIANFLNIRANIYSLQVPPEFTDADFISQMQDFLRWPEKFYHYAVERDGVLVGNLIKRMEEADRDRAALIIGGFHANGVEEELRGKGYQVITVTPTITKSDPKAKEIYLSRMMDKSIQPEEILARRREAAATLQQPLITAAEFQAAEEALIAEIQDAQLRGKVERVVAGAEEDFSAAELARVRSVLAQWEARRPDSSAVAVLRDVIQTAEGKEAAPAAETPDRAPPAASIPELKRQFPGEIDEEALRFEHRDYMTEVAPKIEEYGLLAGGLLLLHKRTINSEEWGEALSLAVQKIKRINLQGLFYLVGYRTFPVISFMLMLFSPFSWGLAVAVILMNLVPTIAFILAHPQEKLPAIVLSLVITALGSGLAAGLGFLAAAVSPSMLFIGLGFILVPVLLHGWINYYVTTKLRYKKLFADETKKEAAVQQSYNWALNRILDEQEMEEFKAKNEDSKHYISADKIVNLLNADFDEAKSAQRLLNKENLGLAVMLMGRDGLTAEQVLAVFREARQNEQYARLLELRMAGNLSGRDLTAEEDLSLATLAVLYNNLGTMLARTIVSFNKNLAGSSSGNLQAHNYLQLLNRRMGKPPAADKAFMLTDLKEMLGEVDDQRLMRIVSGLGFTIAEGGEIFMPFNLVTAVYRGTVSAMNELGSHFVTVNPMALLDYAQSYLQEVDDLMLYFVNNFQDNDAAARYPKTRDDIGYSFAYTRYFARNPEELEQKNLMVAQGVAIPEFARKRTVALHGESLEGAGVTDFVKLLSWQLRERVSEAALLENLQRISQENLSAREKGKVIARIQEAAKKLREECGFTYLYWLVNYGYLEDQAFLMKLVNVTGSEQEKEGQLKQLLSQRRRQSCRETAVKIDPANATSAQEFLAGTYAGKLAPQGKKPDLETVSRKYQRQYLEKVRSGLLEEANDKKSAFNLLDYLNVKREMREVTGLESASWEDVGTVGQAVFSGETAREQRLAEVEEEQRAELVSSWQEEVADKSALQGSLAEMRDRMPPGSASAASGELAAFQPDQDWFALEVSDATGGRLSHGIAHETRVLLLADLLLRTIYRDADVDQAAVRWGSVAHDVGIESEEALWFGDGYAAHGQQSAERLTESKTLAGLRAKIGASFALVQKLAKYHSMRDRAAASEDSQARLALEILKRADSLDRIGGAQGQADLEANPDYRKFMEDPATAHLHQIALWLHEISEDLIDKGVADEYTAVIEAGRVLGLVDAQSTPVEQVPALAAIAMKPIGRKMSPEEKAELDSRQDAFSGKAGREAASAAEYATDNEFTVDLSWDNSSALVIEAELGKAGAYSFTTADGRFIVVLNAQASDAVKEEGLFHELREYFWVQQGIGNPHAVTAYEQAVLFSRDGELTEYHSRQLEQMIEDLSFADLLFIVKEDRAAYHRLLAGTPGALATVAMVSAYEDKLKTRARELLINKLIAELSEKLDLSEEALRQLMKPVQDDLTMELTNALYQLLIQDGQITEEELAIIEASAEKVDKLFAAAEAQGFTFSGELAQVKERITLRLAGEALARKIAESSRPAVESRLQAELSDQVGEDLVGEILGLQSFFVAADGSVQKSIFYEQFISQVCQAHGLAREAFSAFENYQQTLAEIQSKMGAKADPQIVILMARYATEGDALLESLPQGERKQEKSRIRRLFSKNDLQHLIEVDEFTLPEQAEIAYGLGSVKEGARKARQLSGRLTAVRAGNQSVEQAASTAETAEVILHSEYGVCPAMVEDGVVSELDSVPVDNAEANAAAKQKLAAAGRKWALVEQGRAEEAVANLDRSAAMYQAEETFDKLLPEQYKRETLVGQLPATVFLQDSSLFVGTPAEVGESEGKYNIRDVGASGIAFIRSIQESRHQQYFLYQTEAQKEAMKIYLAMHGITDAQFLQLAKGETCQDVKGKIADLAEKTFVAMLDQSLSERVAAEAGDRVLLSNEEGADLGLMSRMAMLMAAAEEVADVEMPLKELLMYYYNDTGSYSVDEISDMVTEWLQKISENGIWQVILPKITPFVKDYYDALKGAREVIRSSA